MSVSQFIVHNIDKTDITRAAEVICRTEENPTEPYGLSILSEFKRIQSGRANRQYGAFNDESNAFKALVLQWREGQIPFNGFAERVSRQLGLLLDNQEQLVSGNLFFLLEKLDRGDRLFVFILRQTGALTLNNALELSRIEYLDFSEVGFGVCIDLTEMEADAPKYLTVSFGRGDRGLQPVLMEWLGYIDKVDKKAETEQFLKLVDAYCDSLPEDEVAPIKEKVIDFCVEQDKAGEAVVYKDLSAQVDEKAPERFEAYLRDNQPVKKEELIPDRRQLRQYIRLSGRSGDLSISFGTGSLGKGVQFNPDNETLVISSLPPSLLKQLKKLQEG
ncbi:nucleoid-associated protein [Nitrincola sp. MINF-07-Sa-05]|uniref:nucleoid-associated protein n=1 Tax=Nitrincola salilacus TaxID=3400273 RepID=UPI0039184C5F